MADGNQASFGTQSDPNTSFAGPSGPVGAVYVAYTMPAVQASSSTPGSTAAVFMLASADGGRYLAPGPQQVTGALTEPRVRERLVAEPGR